MAKHSINDKFEKQLIDNSTISYNKTTILTSNMNTQSRVEPHTLYLGEYPSSWDGEK